MNVSARSAADVDLPELVRLAEQFATEVEAERGGWLWLRNDPARGEPEQTLRSAIADPRAIVLVGLIDDVSLGYIVARLHPMRDDQMIAVISDILVEEPARGVGVGAALIEKVLIWAKERECVGVDATALPGMRSTKNFFEAWGFTARALIVHRSLRERPAVPAGAVPDPPDEVH